jgi:1,2-diacylglycerol 3-alpha-glucosyltransferase
LRIGIFTDSWVPNLNGVVISIINEVQSLKNKHDFAIFVPKLKQGTPFRIEGIPIYELPSLPFPPYPGYNIAFPSIGLTKVLRKEKFDFIHCHSPFSLGYFATLTARAFYSLPLLNTYHTHLVEYSGHLAGGVYADKVTALLENAVWQYVRWFYRYSDVIVTPSKTLQKDLLEHGVKYPVYSLPNMISKVFLTNTKNTKDDTELQNNIKEQFGIRSDHRIILYCGRVSYEKKLEVLLQAFKGLQKSHPKAFLLIVGDGPHLKNYQKQAVDLNITDYAFTGFISHTKLPAIYRMAEFMVTPSDTETQGLTVLEAMSQGLPVIGVARGGVLDYISHQKTGLLSPPGDSQKLGSFMELLLSEPDTLSKYSRNAVKTANRFSSQGYISLLEKAFQITTKIFNETH